MSWYLLAFKKCAQFSGRSRRMEFWMFQLVNVFVSLLLQQVDHLAGLVAENQIGLLNAIYSVVVILPDLSLSVRRLHDTGRSAWWLLLTPEILVPVFVLRMFGISTFHEDWSPLIALVAVVGLVGFIVLLFFFAYDSAPGANRFGPNPKESAVPPIHSTLK